MKKTLYCSIAGMIFMASSVAQAFMIRNDSGKTIAVKEIYAQEDSSKNVRESVNQRGSVRVGERMNIHKTYSGKRQVSGDLVAIELNGNRIELWDRFSPGELTVDTLLSIQPDLTILKQ